MKKGFFFLFIMYFTQKFRNILPLGHKMAIMLLLIMRGEKIRGSDNWYKHIV